MPASLFTAASRALAGELASMRDKAGMTQRQLAAALDREQNLVARIEQSQRRVDLVELIQWIRACGFDPKAEIPGSFPKSQPWCRKNAESDKIG